MFFIGIHGFYIKDSYFPLEFMVFYIKIHIFHWNSWFKQYIMTINPHHPSPPSLHPSSLSPLPIPLLLPSNTTEHLTTASPIILSFLL